MSKSIILRSINYHAGKPVTTNIVTSRLGDSVWFLRTSLSDPRQAVAWYKRRFWIEEMFRDVNSRLGLRQARLKNKHRLACPLVGYQLACFILSVIGSHLSKRWQRRLSSRARQRLCLRAAVQARPHVADVIRARLPPTA